MMLITDGGQTIRVPVDGGKPIRIVGVRRRASRCSTPADGEKVVSVERISEPESDDEEAEGAADQA